MDSWLFFSIFGLSGENIILDSLMIWSAQDLLYLSLLLTVFFALRDSVPEKKAFFIMLFSIPISILLIKLIHIFIYEPRPFISFAIDPLISHASDASFPSRHTTIMANIAASYFFTRSKCLPLFLIFLLAVGISRIYVGVHYPIDIIGGALLGVLSTLISILVLKKILT